MRNAPTNTVAVCLLPGVIDIHHKWLKSRYWSIKFQYYRCELHIFTFTIKRIKMKSLIWIFALLLFSVTLKAQEPIEIKGPVIGHWNFNDILKATDKNVVVVDSVYGGRAFENHTLLNIGGKFPNQLLSVFIAKKDYQNFEGDILKLYLNKKISVSGKVTNFKDKAQIVVTDQKQINHHLDWKPGLNVVIIRL